MASKQDVLRLTQTVLAQADREPDASEYQDLIDLLRFHEHRYYVLDDPLVSDREYDALYERLGALEARHPDIVRPESPTQRVGSDLTSDFANVEHLVPMLSLANSYDLDDLQEWQRSVRRYLNVGEDEPLAFAVEPKYDGGSIAIVYERDRLARAATRGNGSRGEDVTNNVRTVPTVPLTAAFSALGMDRVELRGEVLIRQDRFAELNALRDEAGQSRFANPRNAATGALRMKDPRETAERRLDAFVYQLGYGVDAAGADRVQALGSHFAAVQRLGELGFLVPGEHMRRCDRIEDVARFCASMEARRPELPYELDGMVVKVDDLALQARLGSTSHHPRWAIAYKFAARQATSTLERVDYQVGKIGSITPVARVTPVALAGVTVSNVSLHNEDFIRDKDIRIGDRVLVERAGDVIPYIVRVLPEFRDGSQRAVDWPTVCPVCGQPIVRPEGEARWLCINPDCPAQVRARLEHHVSKHAMDVDGLGPKQLERFIDAGWVRSLPDVYRLPYAEILELEGFKERSVENLAASIERAKRNPISRLLFSLSIHHLGRKASKMLAAEVNDVRELADWPRERFLAMHGLGATVADNVSTWFALPHNREILDELARLGVNVRQTEKDRPREADSSAPLSGKSILFTGTLSRVGRKEAQAMAEAAGARNVSAVSGKLDVLVAGEKAGSKLKKAQALGSVQILSEGEFIELVGGA